MSVFITMLVLLTGDCSVIKSFTSETSLPFFYGLYTPLLLTWFTKYLLPEAGDVLLLCANYPGIGPGCFFAPCLYNPCLPSQTALSCG
ncbi:hypothetical protein GDO78_013522 [Eleutherodactylus coqui]|uniref:Uncharacterized protein n=1 Tax=Eleutherodactylus coqui TaxID=57060 RepID=A0A8J6K2G5_ELECQ|nr:hypothetical protein GDO78_013522 [Eleutherodactylus coqui]